MKLLRDSFGENNLHEIPKESHCHTSDYSFDSSLREVADQILVEKEVDGWGRQKKHCSLASHTINLS